MSSVLLFVLSCATALPALAQESKQFDIPAEPLADALSAFGEQSGLQFSADSGLLAGKLGAALHGSYPAEEGLRRLLAGTGLAGRLVGPGAVSIEGAAPPRVLGPVRVEGAPLPNVNAVGANGSTDPTSTENSGSLAASKASIGGMEVLPLREIPQPVTVVTQQRIEDQDLDDISTMLQQMNGVLVRPYLNGIGGQYFSRGFQIERTTLDGGVSLYTPDGNFGFEGGGDLAAYDHAELLRGADGLDNGYNEPGGTLNLARKRPLDHEQVVAKQEIGSWNLFREQLDATAPLAFDGALRGRVVIARQDNDYFYQTDNMRRTLAYGIVEADLAPGTLLDAGINFTDKREKPWFYGLPTYQSGKPLNLPRDTCLCFPWEYDNATTDDSFLTLAQNLGPDWSAKLSLDRQHQDNSQLVAAMYGGVNDITGQGFEFNQAFTQHIDFVQNAADFKLVGNFPLFGRKQELALGFNYTRISADYSGNNTNAQAMAIDPFHFDPASVPTPTVISDGAFTDAGWGQFTYGGDVVLKLSPVDHVKLIGALRWSHYSFAVLNEDYPGGALNVRATDQYFGPSYVAATWDFTEHWTGYASWSQVYESNNDFETAGGGLPLPTVGNNYEAGLKYQADGGRLNATASLFHVSDRNFSETSSVSGGNPYQQCCVENTTQRIISEGLDLEIAGQLLPGWQLSAGYNYVEQKYQNLAPDSFSSVVVGLYPRHLFKLWTTYRPRPAGWERLSFGTGIEARSRSSYPGDACSMFQTDPTTGQIDCAPNGNVVINYGQAFYALFSLRMGVRLDRHWSIAANVDNLLDRVYYSSFEDADFLTRYGTPRSFTLTLTGRL